MAYQIQGRRVSRAWFDVLSWAERDGVRFQLNSGQRTFAEQVALVRAKGLWSPTNPTGAASPTHVAPHIRTGRQDHALDVQTGAGQAALIAWCALKGLPLRRTVMPDEPWHLEAASEAALLAVARKARRLSTPLARLRVSPMRQGYRSQDVRAVQVYLKRAGLLPAGFRVAARIGTYGPVAVAAVKRFQRRVGLTADGVVGPKTFAGLRRRYGWRVWSGRR